MSASSKKKLRKEQNAAEMTEKQLTAQKEAKKLKAYTVTFIVVMVLVLCLAIGLFASSLIASSGIIERNTVAVTIGDHEISAAELNYYYIDAVNSTYSEWENAYGDSTSMYISMLMGLDLTQPLSEQTYMNDETITWADYFIDTAIESAKGNYAMYDLAVAAGYTLSEEDAAEIDSMIGYVETMAYMYGYSDVEEYLKSCYGNGATVDGYRAYSEVSTIARNYYNDYSASLTYDDAAIRAYEEGREAEYSSFSYASYYQATDAFLEGGTTADDGSLVYSDEEKAAAIEKADAAMTTVLESATSLEAMDEAIAALEINAGLEIASTKYEDQLYTDISASLQEWLADDSRKAGDTAILPNESVVVNDDGTETVTLYGYYVVYFESRNDNEMKLINARHILSSFAGGTTDDSGVTTYTEEEKQASRDIIAGLQEEWETGAATEESFAEIASRASDDPGSVDNGGLYENIYPGQMVANFNDWCYDESRKPGDTGVVETEYGVHLMYFVGESDMTYRDYMISTELAAEELSAWYTVAVDAVTVTEGDTSRLPRDLVLSPAA